jgi:transcription elongation factor Elf1
MKFIKIAHCDTCGTKLVGTDLNKIGDKYYCYSDYSKELEKNRNKIIDKKVDEINKIYGK